MITAEEILAGIRNPSVAMSREQIESAWEALRVRHKTIQAMAATQFTKGDTVEFDDRGGKVLSGVVKKVNQKTVSVDVKQKVLFGASAGTERVVTWRVAASLLRKAK